MNIRRKLALVAVLCLALVSIGSLVVTTKGADAANWSAAPAKKDVQRIVSLYKNCLPYTDASRQCLMDAAFASGKVYGPPASLDALDLVQETAPEVGSYCHTISHTLGKYAYEQRRDIYFALRYIAPICDGGYQHGVFITWGYDLLDQKADGATIEHGPFQAAVEFCNGVKGWAGTLCYHGVGHASWKNFPSVDDMVALCELADTQEGRESCIEGSLMESVYPTDRDGTAAEADEAKLRGLPAICASLSDSGWTALSTSDGRGVRATCRAGSFFPYMNKYMEDTLKLVRPAYEEMRPAVKTFLHSCELLFDPNDQASAREVSVCRGLIGWNFWYTASQDRQLAISYCKQLDTDLQSECARNVDVAIYRNTKVTKTGGGA